MKHQRGSQGATVQIINPNGSAAMTRAVQSAAEQIVPAGVPFRVAGLPDAPEAIETAEDKAVVEPLLVDHLAGVVPTARAVVVACHGDPALDRIRRTWPSLVTVGIGEASLLTAAMLGATFGVVTPVDTLVAPKHRQVERYGLAGRCVGVESTATGVLHALTDPDDAEPYVRAAEKLVAAGASAVVMGCAALSEMSETVARHVPVPVVDPLRSALTAVVSAGPTAYTASGG